MLSRQQARTLVDDPRFQRFIIAVILVNAATMAMETSRSLEESHGGLLVAADRVALAIFCVELSLKLYAYRREFWRDPWNVFDFVIVAVALVPASGPLSVLRSLRLLRVMRLVSAVPSMRRVVNGLFAAIPGMASIAGLLCLVTFVSAVMATQLFREAAPRYFGDLGKSLFTLFQTMTGEAWPDIAADVMKEEPYAWIFFVVFILISTFAVVNLFIGVVVGAMEDQLREETEAAEDVAHAEVMAELRSLREDVQRLAAGVTPDARP